MTKIDDMREAFEAWEATPEGDFATHEDGFYAGYKAAKASQPDVETLIVEIDKLACEPETWSGEGYQDALDDVDEIICKWAKGEV